MNCCSVGQAAGKVWMVLGEKGEMAIARIPRILKIRTHTAYQAVGWLAKEGKIRQEEKDGDILVSLTEAEMKVFRELF